MHSGEQSSSPLPPVLGPKSKEAPIYAFAFDKGAKVQNHEAFCEALNNAIHFVVALPLVIAEERLALVVFLFELLTSSEEWLVATSKDISSEDLQDSVTVRCSRLPVEVFVVFGVDLVADQLSRVAGGGWLVCSELGVLDAAFDAVA